MEENKKEWIGKKIYLVLKSGRRYSGKIENIDVNFMTIIDKFNEKVMVSISEISSMEEEE